MAADLPLPRKFLLMVGGRTKVKKISKSIGNTIDPIELVHEFGSDAFDIFIKRSAFWARW